jgi:hypothetical protein
MRVEIIDITDRSGSMADIRNDVIGGYNAMIMDQKTVPGEARLTQVQFDDRYELNFEGKNIQEVEPLTLATYTPRGTTALLDAIGRTLNEQGKRIASENWAEKVVVCIRTDGHENASKEYKLEQVKQMILHAQAHGWTFIFSAADQDAFAAGAAYGINAAHTSGYDKSDPHGTMRSYAGLSASLTSIRTDSNQQYDHQNSQIVTDLNQQATNTAGYFPKVKL